MAMQYGYYKGLKYPIGCFYFNGVLVHPVKDFIPYKLSTRKMPKNLGIELKNSEYLFLYPYCKMWGIKLTHTIPAQQCNAVLNVVLQLSLNCQNLNLNVNSTDMLYAICARITNNYSCNLCIECLCTLQWGGK